MIVDCANSILSDAHTGDGPAAIVSVNWTPRFLERHPEYAHRKQHSQELARKLAAEDPEAILEWFEGYDKLVRKYGIQERDTYNYDESGFRIGIGRDHYIVTREWDTIHTTGSKTTRDSVTLSETISGDGETIAPMIILPGVEHQARFYTETSIENKTLVALTDTGYTNDELSLKWLEHFDKMTNARRMGTYRLLLLDGHGSHTTKQFLQYCHDRKIICYRLLPHTTHLMQPLDVVVFQPYKHHHAEAVDEATRTGCVEFNKMEFLAALPEIRKKTFKRSTIQSAWRQSGLIPYNPRIVLDKILHLATPEPEGTPEHPTTPEPPTTPSQTHHSPPPIPLTARSMARQAQFLWDPENDPTSITYRYTLSAYLKGSVATAHLGAHVQKKFAATDAAQRARQRRANGSKKYSHTTPGPSGNMVLT